ncbi:thiol:disulfide interchange protein [Litorivicinus lipolyticus]|uniref:Thiol:disulfide interchange protein n=1 Tax=Litorivicinus lipolyticus TaxID=418701 RepID=A0A5Q2Q8J2_9GAMM|nr:protein-disulfide reductase DsbD domain-containing protein [Litorivicinus lipolyticus]QGG79403.1 thiol:disulfide interchange protein [Litorivicinus lipolyticus]
MRWLLLIAAVVLSTTVRATTLPAGTVPALVSESGQLTAGQTHWVGLHLRLQPGWHTYWRNAGASGAPAQIDWALPPSWIVGSTRWPTPEAKVFAGLNVFGYESEVLLMAPIQVPWDYQGASVTVSADANWLTCRDICVPESATLSLTLGPDGIGQPRLFAQTRAALPASEPLDAVWDARGRLAVSLPAGIPSGSRWQLFPYSNDVIAAADFAPVAAVGQRAVFSASPGDVRPRALVVHQASGQSWPLAVSAGAVQPAQSPWLQMLLFALVGGVLLNLMPCVFPILSIKALGLAQSAGLSRSERLTKGLVFTLGVLVSFVVLAAGLLSLRQLGLKVGWGFQLQSPWFVGAMALVMLAVTAALAGVIELRGSWAGVGQGLTQSAGWRGDFFTGVLAVVVSSPCTAPLMGPAMGFALASGTGMTLATFVALGLGLALPMLLLHLSPALARALPRPGPWMLRFKQFLAFPMGLTGLWLVWILGRQIGVGFDFRWALGVVVVALIVWVWRIAEAPRLAVGLVLAALIWAGFGIQGALQPRLQWAPYSAQSLADHRAGGRTVLTNMTADWCISCLANEQLVFSHPSLAGLDVSWLKGDWTDYDPTITAYLDSYGRIGVPLYVVYRPAAMPQVLGQVLTLDGLTEALSAEP